jgi:Nif-specific regulatory protein
MRRLAAQVARAAATGTPVTLRGEPGSGRTFFARMIHRASGWAGAPVIDVACDRSPDVPTIVGPLQSRATLLLLDVNELTLSHQAMLARTLAHQAFRRADDSAHPLIRLLATASADLDEEMRHGLFRSDLSHRRAIMTIVVPPLRERRDEVPILAYDILRRFALAQQKSVQRISAEAMARLATYPWPGNVQELADALEHAVALCDEGTIHARHLPLTVLQSEHQYFEATSLEESVNAYERDLIQDALRSTRGSRAKAARLLKTSYRVLHYKTRKYGIDYQRFKA